MAAIENIPQQKNKTKCVKKTTRVDLTPMVDLGFLLITFFVFTTTMARPTAMKVIMPNDKSGPADEVCNSCALTVMLDKNDEIRYFEGAMDTAHLGTTDYNGIRQIIRQKKEKVKYARGSADQFVLIIKPSSASSFKNFVDITDEVTINNISRYYIDELTSTESKKLID